MSISALPKTWSSGEVLTHTDLNANFTTIRNDVNNATTGALFKSDAGQTVAAAVTWSAAQTFSVGFTVSASGITVTGNSTITGTLSGLTGLTVASGGATITAGNFTVTSGNLVLTAGHLQMTAGQANAVRYNAGDSGTALTLNWNNGNVQRLRLTNNCTLTLSNPVTGAGYVIELLQDTTGSRTVTWPATLEWEGDTAPTLTTTASKKDIVLLLWNGSAYLATVYGQNYSDTV